MTETRRSFWFCLGCALGCLLVVSSARALTTVGTWTTKPASTTATYIWCVNGAPGGTPPNHTNPYCSSDPVSAGNLWAASLTVPTFVLAYQNFTSQYGGYSEGYKAATNQCYGAPSAGACPATGATQATTNYYRACLYGSGNLVWGVYSDSLSACAADPGTPPPDACSSNKGKEDSEGFYSLGTSPTATFAHVTCDNGCEQVFSGECPAATSLVSGVVNYYCQGSFTGDGASCTGSTTPAPATPPPDSCPTGQHVDDGPPKSCKTDSPPSCPHSWETMSGGVCTPNPCSSGYTRDDSTGDCNPTPCPTGQIHDPVTGACGPGTPPPGGDPKPPPPPPDQPPPKTFCEANPTDPACAKDSFSSSCNASHATTSCQGDPVQCAQAEAAAQIACDYEPNAAAWTALRSTIGNAYTPSNYKEAVTQTYDVSSVLDFSDKDAGASCPADKTFTAMGGTYTIPMSPFCTLAGYVKFFLIFAATIIALRLAFAGV